jgi:(R,R)-butanediol dehydrogenase/meso-butanediol dehydrogenase/diacetyl reductase
LKALVYLGKYKVSYQEKEDPVIGKNEALVKVISAGICGTDLNIYAGKHPRVKAPLIIGHEFYGQIVDISADQRYSLRKNQKVVASPLLSCGQCRPCKEGIPHVCNNLRLIGIDRDGAFAEYVKVPLNNILSAESISSPTLATLVEPLAVGIHALNRTNPMIGDIVLLFGCGPIGFLLAFVLRMAGLENILIAEINDHRIRRARDFGFQVVHAHQVNLIEFVKDKTDGNGADIVFESSGSPVTYEFLPQLTKVHGKITLVGVPKEPSRFDVVNTVFKEISYVSSRVYTYRDLQSAVSFLQRADAQKLESIVSHNFSLRDGARALQVAGDPVGDQLKVMLHP